PRPLAIFGFLAVGSAFFGSTGTNWAKVSRTRAVAVNSGAGLGSAAWACTGWVWATFGAMVGCVVSNTMRSGHFCSDLMRRVDLSTVPALWTLLSATALGENKSNANSRAI